MLGPIGLTIGGSMKKDKVRRRREREREERGRKRVGIREG